MKFYGYVGFWLDDQETAPGVFEPAIVERKYTGDMQKYIHRWTVQNEQNDKFKVENTISIIADMFARKNFPSIKYVRWDNTKLKVTSVQLDYPRIKLEIGGPWNGESGEESLDATRVTG